MISRNLLLMMTMTLITLILLKSGGRIIYSGPLGLHSSRITDYFESISGVPKIINNYNPATWMLEITSLSAEEELSLDFAQIYESSSLHKLMYGPRIWGNRGVSLKNIMMRLLMLVSRRGGLGLLHLLLTKPSRCGMLKKSL